MADADPAAALPTTGPLRTVELIRDRAVEAVLGQSGLNHPGLAAEVRRRFGHTDVAEGALVREPLIEGAAPFVASGRTFADCSGDPLHPAVVRAIGSDAAGDYRFSPDMHPYKHQLEAWEHLRAPERRSVLVSSGTGSGKTECFLMPLLSDLAAEAETGGKLSGVRAIALYPLNALIASQEERLRAWTAPFGERLRFGLYNGLTPERRLPTDPQSPEQVKDREALRRDPPPILVTNVTMLENMIVRRNDRPLIENSRGKLRWIILDEAHGYIGSAAAEIALLIRRVLLTFCVRAEDVRFVATSATIGDGKDVTDNLRRFLRDLSGADQDRVKVVVGERERVLLPSPDTAPHLARDDLGDRDRVAANPAVQAFIRAAEQGPVTLARARTLLAPTGEAVERVVEAIADNRDMQRGPLLPLRVHGFLRAVPGLWSCLNPGCASAPSGWPFGAVLVEKVDVCPTCRSPVFEVKACRECGETYLECEERDGHLHPVTTPPTVDEFAVTIEHDLTDEEAVSDHDYEAQTLALATRNLPGGAPIPVEPSTGRRPDRGDDRTQTFQAFYFAEDACGGCGAARGGAGPVLRPLRYGAPFLIGNAAPVLLEGMPARPADGRQAFAPPSSGRQLLSFTDSRQGTARFAANLQNNAERSYVRGYLYHAVQGSMAAGDHTAEIAQLRTELETFEAINNPGLADIIAQRRARIAELSAPSTAGIPWLEMREQLGMAEPVKKWMREVWQHRDERYRADPLAFAEFLLLRELARRPRRANTAETMGLVRLRFDQIDKASNVPPALTEKGFGRQAWQGMLATLIDQVVRTNLAIRAVDADVHWITSRGWKKTLLPFGEKANFGGEQAWPMAGAGGAPSNIVLILERSLGLDRSDAQDRALINEVLEAAWTTLSPLFHSNTQPGYALDFTKARIAPVIEGSHCPVSRRILSAIALGLSPYGHREHLRTAEMAPRPIAMPRLPITFPREDQVETLRNWLAEDPQVAELRTNGDWTDLHDRVALLSPYLRAAEHSAQQPPARLRRFEDEFKRGEINILNCSTTMEMGVDIGSVSAVMMTNVPPALANYRQRVGRAGRRRQGFASSLTYTRDTQLDREAFLDPVRYLTRETKAPRVKLDSRRIVQRHVNALLLARWFAGEGGEAMKTRVGDFFGLPGELGTARLADAPVSTCLVWLDAPDTAHHMDADIAQLIRGTVLENDRTVFAAAKMALHVAAEAVALEWRAIQQQAETAPPEGKASLRYQLERLVRDNLLKELGYRGVLPAHGFPTGVVPFINDDRPTDQKSGDDDASRRRRSFPTRTLDIAIRDYAPGAEVVVDGLVYRSRGVTLNWQRPASDVEAREIQNLRTFWMCAGCGAADAASVVPENCPACHVPVTIDRQRRFLEPAGFTADMRERPHADTDEVTYVEPELEQLVARGAAWSPMADPALGRLRASHEGLVFYSSRGPTKQGYHVCLDCGRAAPAGEEGDAHPLKGHAPLRFTKKGLDGVCPGNAKPFKITPPIALGYETMTDVVELQPIGLEIEGAAWAAGSALRSALARRLGIEAGELGLSARRVSTTLGQPTHSLFLYDRASGGAGFSPQAITFYEGILRDAASILNCGQPGCERGCSACVLASDLYRQAEIIDRKAALVWARAACEALADVGDADRIAADAVLARSIADEIAGAAEAGAKSVTVWLAEESDVAGLNATRLAGLIERLCDRGVSTTLVVSPEWLARLDASGRLSLRDAALRLGVTLRQGAAPRFDNDAVAVAATGGDQAALWASRDIAAGAAGNGWGQPGSAPIVRIAAPRLPLATAIDLSTLLPVSGTRYLELGNTLDGTIAGFGERLAARLVPAIRAAGGDGTLARIAYNDRYLQSPLLVRLMAGALAGLRDALGAEGATTPAKIVTNRLKPNERQPFAPDHDWQWEEDRAEVLCTLLEDSGFVPDLVERGAAHGRVLALTFASGKMVRVVFDQGFGPWRTPSFARWPHFGDAAPQQATKIASYSAMIEARGPSYVVVTA